MHSNSDMSLQPTCVQPTIDVPSVLDPPTVTPSVLSFDATHDTPTADTDLGERSNREVVLSPHRFVTTMRGSSPGSMLVGVIPSNPGRRRSKARMINVAPWHSARLAKKARSRTPAVAAAQNVLMKKLGISKERQLETVDFERYITIFEKVLIDEQIKLIRDLFMESDEPLAEAHAEQEAS
jgi:hypothetical protein